MSTNEPFIESYNIFSRSVETNWFLMATKKLTTRSKKKKFLALLEKEIIQEASGSNIIFVEEGGDVYMCMIFRAKNIIEKVVIDVLDPNRKKPIEPHSQSGNVYIYGASGTLFQPTVNNGFLDIVNSEKTGDFDG